jgi:hypothetical protein
MYFPRVADATQLYDTVFVRGDARDEKRVTKRLRAMPTYRDYVVVAESWTPTGDYTLFRYPTMPAAPPDIKGLLRALQFMQRARIVHGQLNAEALRGGRITHFAKAVDMAAATTHASRYFFPDAGPPDKRELGFVAQGFPPPAFLKVPREAAVLELVKGWQTWDLYDLSGLVDHPLAARCRSERVSDRPTIAECLAALKEPSE